MADARHGGQEHQAPVVVFLPLLAMAALSLAQASQADEWMLDPMA